MENYEYEIDLKEIFSILKKRWLMIFCFTVIVIIVAGVINFFVIIPTYESSTTMLVNYKQNQEVSMSYSDMQMSQKLVNTYSQIIKSRTIAEDVISNLRLNLKPEDIQGMISVSGVGDTEILKITVLNQDPTLATEVANTVAEVAKREIKSIMKVDNITIIDLAIEPENPVKPNKMMNMAIAGVLGMVLSMVFVCVIEFLNRTYKTPTDIERHLGLPIIGAIPNMELAKPVK